MKQKAPKNLLGIIAVLIFVSAGTLVPQYVHGDALEDQILALLYSPTQSQDIQTISDANVVQGLINRTRNWMSEPTPMRSGLQRLFYRLLAQQERLNVNGNPARVAQYENNARILDDIAAAERARRDAAAKNQVNCDGFAAVLKHPVDCGVLEVMAWLGMGLVWLFSWILWLAGMVFNWAIDISVGQFKELAEQEGVKTAWSIGRNLVNSVLIFVLLYIALGIILQISGGESKRMLTRVIIVALLVNFSFFLTSVVIDASNVLANAFYDRASGGEQLEGTRDISTQLIKKMGLNYSVKPPAQEPGEYKAAKTFGGIIASTLGKIILIIITSVVLFAASVMFFARTVVLIILLVLSPFAFLFWVLPKAKQYAEKWWGALFNQAIFAPAFLFMVYLTVQTADGMGAASQASSGFIKTVVSFVMLNGMMLGSLMVAKALGVAGAAAGIKFGKIATAGGVIGGAYLAGKALGGAGRVLKKGADAVTGGKASELGRAVAESRPGRVIGGAVGTLRSTLGAAGKTAFAKMPGAKEYKAAQQEVRKYKKEERERMVEQEEEKARRGLESAGRMPVGPERERAVKEALGKMSEKQVGELPVNKLEGVAEQLSNAQFEATQKSNKLTYSEKQRISEARIKPLKDAVEKIKTVPEEIYDTSGAGVGPNPEYVAIADTIKVKLDLMKPSAKAKLPKEMLVHKAVVKNFTKNDLSKMIDEEVDKEVREEIKKQIAAVHPQAKDIQDWFNLDSKGRLF